MSAGSAQVQSWYRCAVTARISKWSIRENLRRHHCSVKLIASIQAVSALDIEGCQGEGLQDRVLEVRRIAEERAQYGVCEFLATLVPTAVPELVGNLLNTQPYGMCSRGLVRCRLRQQLNWVIVCQLAADARVAAASVSIDIRTQQRYRGATRQVSRTLADKQR